MRYIQKSNYWEVLCLLFLISTNSSTSAQKGIEPKISSASFTLFNSNGSEINPIAIGDKTPNIVFTLLDGPTHVQLSDFEQKLVILDFWSTYCGSCIAQFPKLDSLQEKFENKMQIILVNSIVSGDNETRIRDFFTKRNKITGKPLRLPVAIEDSVAEKLFPFQSIPHYVWVGLDGRVRAITYADQVTEHNIEAVIKNENFKIQPIKKDYYPNQLFDFPINGLLIDENLPFYKFFKKGRIKNLESINYFRGQEMKDSKANYINRGRAMINIPILEMYRTAISYNKKFAKLYTDKRLVLEVKDSSDLVYDPNRFLQTEWEDQHLYSYDFVVSPEEAKNLYDIMIADLNLYSGYNGRIEKRKIKCLSLVRNSKNDKIKTIGGESKYMFYNDEPRKYIHNVPLDRLLIELNFGMKNIKFPVLNETGYKGNVDMEFPIDLYDLNALRKNFQRYDLDLIVVERVLEVFVISGK